MGLAVVRVSSGYFPVLECISYSFTRTISFFLARVRVSSQYFPVLDCILYSCAIKRYWLSLWLVLAVDIFQFWNVYRTVRKKDFVFLARVRISSHYFPVLDCISYNCARKRSWVSLWLGLAVDIFQFWNVYRTVRKMASCFSLGLGLAVSMFQFWIVYHTLAQERDRGSRCG